jgi:hypothetical protein
MKTTHVRENEKRELSTDYAILPIAFLCSRGARPNPQKSVSLK